MRFRNRKQLLGGAPGKKTGFAALRLEAPAISLGEQFEETEKEDGSKVREVPRFKWIHVASEGSFKGHADGEFDLTREVFEQFVKNLREDPRYKAGDDGFGTTMVIPFDFEHVSELDPTSGSIPAIGAPAPAWAMDFEVRDGEDGKAQLWSKTDLLQNPDGSPSLIRKYIATDGYRHVSIAFSLDATDPNDASSIGARISSIAFTNHPFLRNLQPIAARWKDAAKPVSLRSVEEIQKLYWYDPAGSPEQGLQYTRQCLGLPATADATAVKTEIGKLAGFASNPATIPPGVDLDDIFSGLRKIWSLPVTATVAEITAEVDKAAAMVVAAQTTTAPVAAPAPVPAPAPAPATSAAASGKDSKVNNMSFLNRIAKKLRKVNPDIALDDEQVKLEETAEAAVEVAVDAYAQLKSILQAMNKPGAAEVLSEIPELLAAKSDLEGALAQLNEVLSMQVADDAAAAAADVEAAAESSDITASAAVVNAFKVQRESLISKEISKLTGADAKNVKKLAEARLAGRRAFLTEHGVAPKGMEVLLRNHFAAPGGRQLRAPGTGRELEGPTTPERDPNLETIDLTAESGANTFEKLLNYGKREKKLSHENAFSWARTTARKCREGKLAIIDDAGALAQVS